MGNGMPSPAAIKQQVDTLVTYLVEVGLANDQNFAFQRAGAGGRTEITFPQAEHVSIAMRDRDYSEIYMHLARERAYSVKMPDGALVQMMYAFDGSLLERHRLAFFPAPHLEDFQNNPEIYLEDEIYADVVARSIVPFPLRFDYDAGDDVHREIEHPKSHLRWDNTKTAESPCQLPDTILVYQFCSPEFLPHCLSSICGSSSVGSRRVRRDHRALRERTVIHVQIPMAPA